MEGRGDAALEPLARGVQALLKRELLDEERARFSRYLALLQVWNRTHRLTGLRGEREIVHRLFVDSLLYLPLLPPCPLRVADIGSGAGIPGIPIRIVQPGLALSLIESKRKAVSFLLTVKRELQLGDVDVLHGRAEALLREDESLRQAFDVVLVRAAGPIGELLGIASGYLKPSGLFIASGPPATKAPPKIAAPGPEPPSGGWRAEWKDVTPEQLGITRRFLVASRE